MPLHNSVLWILVTLSDVVATIQGLGNSQAQTHDHKTLRRTD